MTAPSAIEMESPPAAAPPARPAAEVPSPPLPRPLQSWLGISRPLAARTLMRKRYGRIFRTNDSIVERLA